MTALAFIVAVFIAYQFGRWVKQSDISAANYSDRKEIERLRAEIVELKDEIRRHEVEESTVAWQ